MALLSPIRISRRNISIIITIPVNNNEVQHKYSTTSSAAAAGPVSPVVKEITVGSLTRVGGGAAIILPAVEDVENGKRNESNKGISGAAALFLLSTVQFNQKDNNTAAGLPDLVQLLMSFLSSPRSPKCYHNTRGGRGEVVAGETGAAAAAIGIPVVPPVAGATKDKNHHRHSFDGGVTPPPEPSSLSTPTLSSTILNTKLLPLLGNKLDNLEERTPITAAEAKQLFCFLLGLSKLLHTAYQQDYNYCVARGIIN